MKIKYLEIYKGSLLPKDISLDLHDGIKVIELRK